MLSLSLLSMRASTSTAVGLVGRTYATAVSATANTRFKRPRPEGQPEGPLRPQLDIQVNPNHGLYGFFRRRTSDNSYRAPAENGPPEYVALERPPEILSGRAWKSVELRRKSFKDLHTLWYVLLRERNLIATQKGELRRFHIRIHPFLRERTRECRLSMARIKQNLTERSKAYMQAAYLRRQLRMKKASNDLPESIPAQNKKLPAPELKQNILEESMLEPSEVKSQL